MASTSAVTLEEVSALAGHSERAWSVSFRPSEPVLASCSTDRSIRLYSYTPQFNFSLASAIPTSHTRTVRNVAFAPTGETLASASFDSTVGIWVKTGAGAGAGTGQNGNDNDDDDDEPWIAAEPLEGHESEAKDVKWSHDGRYLASCSRDKSVWIWEAVGPAEFECVAVLLEHSQDVKSLAWHPTELILASASYDDTIKIYTLDPYDDEWVCSHTLEGHTSTVWSLAFSPVDGGKYLVSTSDDLTIAFWVREPLRPETGDAGVAVVQDGGRMGPWSGSGVKLGDKDRWKWTRVGQIEGAHERSIYCIDWQPPPPSPSSSSSSSSSPESMGRIVTCGADGTINVFALSRPEGGEGGAKMPKYELVASVSDAHGVSEVNCVRWCTIDPKRAAETLRRLEGGDDEEEDQDDGPSRQNDVLETRWKESRNVFASAGDDGLVKIWRVRSSQHSDK